MNGNSKRDRLIDAAAELFYHKGITTTSLADIASRATIPIGNVYYYFKTKEELILSVIEKRKELLAHAYASLEEAVENPRERLVQALDFFNQVRDEYTKYGCPVGRIIAETGNTDDRIAEESAVLFNVFIDWAASQFEQLGHKGDAHRFATSLMAGIQGGTIMAKAAGDANILTNEINRLREWVQDMPNKKIFLGKVAAG